MRRYQGLEQEQRAGTRVAPAAPGRRALTDGLTAPRGDAAPIGAGSIQLPEGLAFAGRAGAAAHDPAQALAIAAEGTGGAAERLPHADVIQAAFGRHDVSGVEAHVAGPAATAASQLGAEAYATGDQVAFRQQPSLHTAAHEAAHVVQAREGVQLLGGAGASDAAAEAHADAVAERVVAGHSAEALLDQAPAIAGGVHRQEAAGETGDWAPELALTPERLEFTAIVVGGAEQQFVSIENRGQSDVDIATVLSDSGSYLAWLVGPGHLGPGDKTALGVFFKPASMGEHNGRITIMLPDDTGLNLLAHGMGSAGPAAPAPAGPAAPQPSTPAGKTPGGKAPAPAPSPAEPPAEPPAETAPAAPRGSRPSPLLAMPTDIQFGLESEDTRAFAWVTNISDGHVDIHDVVVHGDEAFGAELSGSNVLAPDDSAQLVVRFRPQHYDDGDRADIEVVTVDGDSLTIPVTGPPAGSMVSETRQSGLEVEPELLQFEPEYLTRKQDRMLVVRNRTLDHEAVHAVVTPQGSPFQLLGGDQPFSLGPGQSHNKTVRWTPVDLGRNIDTVSLVDEDGAFLARASLAGEARDPYGKRGDEEVDMEVNEPLDGAEPLRKARQRARGVYDNWGPLGEDAITMTSRLMNSEWTRYFGLTSSNPQISRGTFPSASALQPHVENLISNSANLLASVATGAAIGSVAGPAGVAIGAVVGLMVDTFCTLLFQMFGDDDVAEAAREAYEQGMAAGSKLVARLVEGKMAEVGSLHTVATREFRRHRKAFLELAYTGQDVDQVDKVTAAMREHVASIRQLELYPGQLSTQLLSDWVRDHAASGSAPGKDVSKVQWTDATRELEDETRKQNPGSGEPAIYEGAMYGFSDLWVSQTLHEWKLRGIPAPENFRANMEKELEDHVERQRKADRLADVRPAVSAHELFHNREFIWGSVAALEGARVHCWPKLGNDGNCYAKEFHYLVELGHTDVRYHSKPGDEKWTPSTDGTGKVTPGPARTEREDAELFSAADALQNDGVTVERKDTAWLVGRFGPDAARPESQDMDAGAAAVTVFHARTSATSLASIKKYKVAEKDGLTLYKGGNTVLVAGEAG